MRPVLGVFRLWGLSAAQSLLGLLFIAAALREAVPGRMLPRGRVCCSRLARSCRWR